MRISGCRAASILAPAGSGLTAFAIILWSSGFMLAQRRTSGGQEASIWPVLARLLDTSISCSPCCICSPCANTAMLREDDRRSPFDLPAVSNWLSDESRPLVSGKREPRIVE
ncbi:hypothetical protein C8Q77DRAFT_1144472 [Trametes polyzona]|nr:hypothetical protein C8Q77DRAFT_1144472 [Trametes polyzona]